LTYQVQVTPWWQLQPIAQYLANLGERTPDPRGLSKPLGNAALFGLRTAITF
jgi:porin